MVSIIFLPLGSELLLVSKISAPSLNPSALVLFFDWARKSNPSELQNYGIHLATKPKAICST